jgi:hypothetical protein
VKRNKYKICEFFVFIGMENVPHFAYGHGQCTQLGLKARGSAADYTLRQY